MKNPSGFEDLGEGWGEVEAFLSCSVSLIVIQIICTIQISYLILCALK